MVVPVLKERELTNEPSGQLLLVSSLVADFGSIFLNGKHSGAFLGGIIVSMFSKEEGSILRQKLDAIGYGFFIPMIFNALLPAYRPKRDRIVVIGCKNPVQLLIDHLKQYEFHTISLCRNKNRNKKQTAEGIPSIKIQDTISDEMRNAVLEKARAVVAIDETDENNLRLCRMARKMFGVENIIAWVQDPIRNREFRQFGARLVNSAYSSVLIIEGMLPNPDAFSMTADVNQSVKVREIKLKESNVAGLSVSSLNIPVYLRP